MTTPNSQLTDTILRERGRLRNFIRSRIADPSDAEDILQDVFEQLVEAYRLPEPIEQAGAWLFRVARNAIIDRFRKKKEQQLPESHPGQEHDHDQDDFLLDQLLPATDGGPEAAYTRAALIDTLLDALQELPAEQRQVFVAHEIEGQSFNELAAEQGVAVNTLIARKRYAVLHLRARLQPFHDELDT